MPDIFNPARACAPASPFLPILSNSFERWRVCDLGHGSNATRPRSFDRGLGLASDYEESAATYWTSRVSWYSPSASAKKESTMTYTVSAVVAVYIAVSGVVASAATASLPATHQPAMSSQVGVM